MDLAARLGISPGQIGKYAAGINRVAVSRLADIADRLALPVTRLLTE